VSVGRCLTNSVVFVGHFGHQPNVDRAQWRAREIVALVHNEVVTIGFRIDGCDMSAWIGDGRTDRRAGYTT
jgi:hypothetical protein